MAEHIIDTQGSNAVEGHDPLREFLLTHQDALKLRNVNKLNKVHESLVNNDITYDELIEYTSDDLRGLQQMNILQPLQVTRFIKLLSTMPESSIYQENQSKKVIILSVDEEKAIKNIQNTDQKVKKILLNISMRVNELSENAQNGYDIINTKFDAIIQNV
eukprot:217605_1